MGFLKKLFGGQEKSKSAQSDLDGFFFYVQCDNCGKKVRLRIIKQYELNNTGDGYVWHKTIIDNRCFREIKAVVQFDRNFNVSTADIDGGQQISREAFEAEEVS
jgi:hypothetical protein